MTKVIIIVGLILFLLYYISKKLSTSFTASKSPTIITKNGFQKIDTSRIIIADTSQKVMKNVGIGAILLVIMLALIIKIKVLLFLLPISLYMIGYLFLFKNHLKKTTEQVVWYNQQTNDVIIESIKRDPYHFNILRDVKAIQQIESIQNTKGLLFGYFRIKTENKVIEIPYLIFQNNPNNQSFFDDLKKNHKIDMQKKIFPII